MKRKILSSAMTLIHEVAHGSFNGSINKYANSTIYNVHDQLSGVKPDDILKVEAGFENAQGGDRVKGRSMIIAEAFPDAFLMSVVAPDATDAEWEFAKHREANVRKISYIDNYEKLGDTGQRLDLNSIGDPESMQVHDTNYLLRGWIEALDQARNGINPELLDLAKDPLKLSAAIIVTSAHTVNQLSSVTGDWQSIDVKQYSSFVSTGKAETIQHLQSDEFKAVMSNLTFDKSSPENTMDALPDKPERSSVKAFKM